MKREMNPMTSSQVSINLEPPWDYQNPKECLLKIPSKAVDSEEDPMVASEEDSAVVSEVDSEED